MGLRRGPGLHSAPMNGAHYDKQLHPLFAHQWTHWLVVRDGKYCQRSGPEHSPGLVKGIVCYSSEGVVTDLDEVYSMCMQSKERQRETVFWF